ncbi:VOC family protein [Sungkyunkwania multivorans]|uniref:VOC family protein n=1 Tax=Sungkyunkwania multivorans TaxID=1173618 RepID=A0ABW3D0C9_9FLAO
MDLNQVTVPSTDVERAIHFYQTLGLKLIVKALPHYARFECPNGDATFSVHQVESIAEGEGVMVYFEEEDLDDYVSELILKGINFDELPEDRSWLWREARLKDPDGNRLVIYWAGKHRKRPPWRIK